MPHGAPDNYYVLKKSITYGLYDLGELAVRLGSPNLFDRLGDVMFMDSFENGLVKWLPEWSGTNGSIAIDTTTAKTGGFSCKLTTGKTTGYYARITAYMPYPYPSSFGFEFSLAIESNIWYVTCTIDFIKDGIFYRGKLYIDILNETLYYYNKDNVPTELKNAYIVYADSRNYNTLKLVIDTINLEYVRALTSNQLYNMKGLKLHSNTSPDKDHLEIELLARSISGFNGICYIDNVIITQNEP